MFIAKDNAATNKTCIFYEKYIIGICQNDGSTDLML